MQPDDVIRAAEHIRDARFDGRTMSLFPDEIRPRSEEDAYEIQGALHRLVASAQRGRVVGYKIGCTTPVMQEYLGIPNPCAGGLYQPAVHYRQAMVRHADYLHPGVEAELAVFIGDALTPRKGGHTVDSVSGSVQALFAAIELVDDRWEDYSAVDTPTLIADDFFGAGCVLGDPVAAWRRLDLEGLHGEMRINGAAVGEGVGGDIMGHPFRALAWLADSVGERGGTINEGDVVLLGSLVQTRWVERADEIEVEIDGLGTVSAWFG